MEIFFPCLSIIFFSYFVWFPYLDCIPSLWRDPFHGQHNLELHLAGEITGRDLPQWRVLVNLVGDDDWPEHLEKVLGSINFSSEIHALQMVGNYLKYKYSNVSLGRRSILYLPLLSDLFFHHQTRNMRLQ